MNVPDDRYIDVAGGIARVGGNEPLYRRLLGKLEASVDTAGFDAAVAAGDFGEAGKVVHTAKGVAGNLSLPLFFGHCTALMARIRDGEAISAEDAMQFHRIYGETLSAVNAYLDGQKV
jgi:hypothetical protein